MSELSPVRREKIQKRISKAILADETTESVDQIVSVNELSETDADEMIRMARRQRVDVIRGIYMKKVRLGSFIVALGVAVVYLVAMVAGVITRPILLLGAMVVGMGLISIVGGIIGIVMAPSRKGSFLDSAE